MLGVCVNGNARVALLASRARAGGVCVCVYSSMALHGDIQVCGYGRCHGVKLNVPTSRTDGHGRGRGQART